MQLQSRCDICGCSLDHMRLKSGDLVPPALFSSLPPRTRVRSAAPKRGGAGRGGDGCGGCGGAERLGL
eukprot:scaffold47877_cov33-Phaeocystis_antarctica.AAC.1